MKVDDTQFDFGKNWTQYSRSVDGSKIQRSVDCLTQLLEEHDLCGRKFLDIGCGSGLSSLAAYQLGAEVHSLDRDTKCIDCTYGLRERFAPESNRWKIYQGSVLDEKFMSQFFDFEIVYSWGVLHHTGEMAKAFNNIRHITKVGGKLVLAIYNDQGRTSKIWKRVKRLYNRSSKPVRYGLLGLSFARLWGPTLFKDAIKLKPFASWKNYSTDRGMLPLSDLIDWVGGYPFEVAKPEEIISAFSEFRLLKLKSSGRGLGCNEFVFERHPW